MGEACQLPIMHRPTLIGYSAQATPTATFLTNGERATDAMKLLPIILLVQGFTELTDQIGGSGRDYSSKLQDYDLYSINSSQNDCLAATQNWVVWTEPLKWFGTLQYASKSLFVQPQHSILSLDANIRLKSSLLNHGLWTKLQLAFVSLTCWAINRDLGFAKSILNSQSLLTFSVLGEQVLKHDPFSNVWQPLRSQLEFDATRQHNSRFVNIHFTTSFWTVAGQQGYSFGHFSSCSSSWKQSPLGLGQDNNSASQKWPTPHAFKKPTNWRWTKIIFSVIGTKFLSDSILGGSIHSISH